MALMLFINNNQPLFLRMLSMPELDKIDSKRMRVDAMTKKGEVSFVKQCKHLLDLCDEIGTKDDNKHTKRESKAGLNHIYYWVNKEEDTLFNRMKAVYKILNNKDKVKMKFFYHIRCDPDLEEGFCVMQHIPYACTGCVEQLSNTWLPNLDKTYNRVMLSNPKHVSTLSSYVDIINYIIQN